MHLEFSEPVLVSMGPKSREAGWGPHQFARLDRLTDGRIMCSFLLLRDIAEDIGSDGGGFVSEDNGKTWKPGYDVEYRHLTGEKLPDGDFIGWVEPVGLQVDEKETFNHPGFRVGHIEHKVVMHYPYGTLKPMEGWDDGYQFYRIDGKTGEVKPYIAKLDHPMLTYNVTNSWLMRLYPAIKHIRISPEGHVYLPHYESCMNPETGDFNPYYTNVLLKSEDGGRSFRAINYMVYDPEKYKAIDERAHLREGWSENDICWAPDGKTMVKLMRTDGYYPRTKHCQYNSCYITHSTDGGYTWDEPTIFDDRGVMPILHTMKCGVTLATYGRPGCFVRMSTDPEARVWEDRIEIVHSDGTPNDNENCVDVLATCGYSDLVEIDDHTAGFAYSDFTQKDENGVPHKCIMFRTITVVED